MQTNARHALAIDIHEAKGIFKAFSINTIEGLFQNYLNAKESKNRSQFIAKLAKAIFNKKKAAVIIATFDEIEKVGLLNLSS